jgi:hypothetical protein
VQVNDPAHARSGLAVRGGARQRSAHHGTLEASAERSCTKRARSREHLSSSAAAGTYCETRRERRYEGSRAGLEAILRVVRESPRMRADSPWGSSALGWRPRWRVPRRRRRKRFPVEREDSALAWLARRPADLRPPMAGAYDSARRAATPGGSATAGSLPTAHPRGSYVLCGPTAWATGGPPAGAGGHLADRYAYPDRSEIAQSVRAGSAQSVADGRPADRPVPVVGGGGRRGHLTDRSAFLPGHG